MRKSQPTDPMITQNYLFKTHGWTRGLVRQFARIPDETKPNPHFRFGAPMKLFRVKRIAKTEVTSEFTKAMARSNIRKAAARKGHETKRENERLRAESQRKVCPVLQEEMRSTDQMTGIGPADICLPSLLG